MTSDGSSNHSTTLNETKEGTYRLYAFDVTTGEELWHLDQDFQSPPAVVVNEDNSLTSLCQHKALILKN